MPAPECLLVMASRNNITAALDGFIKTQGEVFPHLERRKRKHLILVHFLYLIPLSSYPAKTHHLLSALISDTPV